MPLQEGNLLSERRSWGQDTWLHGSAFAVAGGDLSASFRRGIDLNAYLRFDAGFESNAQLGEAAKVVFAGGTTAGGGLRLQAAFPLDLFNEAGFVARLQAQAKAAAWLRAELQLDAERFRKAVLSELRGSWAEILDIVFQHIQVRAGIWGEASVSAELFAEAALIGHLLPKGDTPPGFTFSAACNTGLGAGGGVNLVANFGFSRVEEMFGSIANRLSSIVRSKIEQQIVQDPSLADVREVLPFVDFLLPLTFRSAFTLGFQLSGASTPEERERVTQAIVLGFIQEGQKFLLRTLIAHALSDINEQLGGSEVISRLRRLSEEDLVKIVTAVDDLFDSVLLLAITEDASPDEWLDALSTIPGPLMRLLSVPLFNEEETRSWKEAVALIWSAMTLVRPILSVAGSSVPLSSGVRARPDDPVLAAYIAERVHPPPPPPRPEALNFGDLFVFIATDRHGHSRAEAVLRSVPRAQSVLEWLVDAVGSSSGDNAFQVFFREAGTMRSGEILNALARAAGRVIEQRMKPFFATLKREIDDQAFQEVLTQVIEPCTLSIVEVILPGIPRTGSGDENRRRVLREQVSVILLQSLSRFLLTGSDQLLKSTLPEAGKYLRDTALVARGGGVTELTEGLTAAVSPIGIDVDLSVAADLLELAASAVDRWNGSWRQKTIESLRSLVNFGLISGYEELDAIWRHLDADERIPLPDRVGKLGVVLFNSSSDLLIYLQPKASDIIVRALARHAGTIVRIIDASVTRSVEVARDTARLLADQAGELAEVIERLEREISEIYERIGARLRQLARELTGTVEMIVTQIQRRGWAEVEAALKSNPVFEFLPQRREIEQSARARYDQVFNHVRHEITAVRIVVDNLTKWLDAEFKALVRSHTVTASRLLEGVRLEILNVANADLTFRIDVLGFDVGTVTLTSTAIVNSVAEFVLRMPDVQRAAGELERESIGLINRQTQRASTKAAIEGRLARAQVERQIANVSTGRPIEIKIAAPKPNATYKEPRGDLDIQLKGVNDNYVTSVLFPSRVRMFVNGVEREFEPGEWKKTPEGLQFKGKVSTSLVPIRRRHGDDAPARLPRVVLCDSGMNVLHLVATDGVGLHAQESVMFFLPRPGVRR